MTKFIRNVLANYSGVAAEALLLIVVTPYVVHKLGVAGYSIWIVAQTLGFYLGFLDLGVSDAQVRQHARLKAQAGGASLANLHATVLFLLLAAGVLGLVLAAALSLLPVAGFLDLPAGLHASVLPVLLLIGLRNLFLLADQALDGVFEGEERFDLLNAVNVATGLLDALAIVVTLHFGGSLMALFAVQAFVAALALIGKYVVLARAAPSLMPLWPRFDRPSWRSIRSYSLWNALNDFVTEGTAHFDKLLIPVFMATALVAPYSLVVMLAAVIFALAEPITDTFLPAFSRHAGNNDRAAIRALLVRGSRLVVTVTLPVTVVVMVFGERLLDVWIGAQYTDVSPAVLWFTAASFFFSTLLWTPLNVIMGAGDIRYIFWVSLLEVALALALIVTLTPRFSLVGLAAAGFVANVAIGLVFFIPRACRIAGADGLSYLRATLINPALTMLPAAGLALWLDHRFPAVAWPLLIASAAVTGLVAVVASVRLAMPKRERLRYVVGLRRLTGLS